MYGAVIYIKLSFLSPQCVFKVVQHVNISFSIGSITWLQRGPSQGGSSGSQLPTTVGAVAVAAITISAAAAAAVAVAAVAAATRMFQ